MIPTKWKQNQCHRVRKAWTPNDLQWQEIKFLERQRPNERRAQLLQQCINETRWAIISRWVERGGGTTNQRKQIPGSWAEMWAMTVCTSE